MASKKLAAAGVTQRNHLLAVWSDVQGIQEVGIDFTSSTERAGDVLDRMASTLNLEPAQRDLFDMGCDLLHWDKTNIYRAMRRKNKARQRKFLAASIVRG